MPYLTWDDNLSVGVREIDTQHKKLVAMVNELHDAMKAGRGKEIMARVLNNLIDYTVSHFATEEKYMDKYNDPAAGAHKNEHVAFVKKVGEFKTLFEAGKATISLDVMAFLKDWLVKHIMETDKKTGLYLKGKGVA